MYWLPCFCGVAMAQSNEGFLAIASMWRSYSTHLCYGLERYGVRCMNEMFRNSSKQSGDVWEVQGVEAGVYSAASVKDIPPEGLGAFLGAVSRSTPDHELVAFKLFPEHLTRDQHAFVLGRPDVTVVVLERDVYARWASEWVAYSTGDWDTKGSERHANASRKVHVPPMVVYNGDACRREDAYCKSGSWSPFCCFYKKHRDWYEFVRRTRPYTTRIEANFVDSTLNIGGVWSGIQESLRV